MMAIQAQTFARGGDPVTRAGLCKACGHRSGAISAWTLLKQERDALLIDRLFLFKQSRAGKRRAAE
jgi:hypothetical protein